MAHEVSVDPVDDTGADISHLEISWNPGASDAANNVNYVSHAPVAFPLNDHRHACFDVQENGIRLGCANTARMVN